MIKTKYNPIPNELCENYFNILINRLYKILPLKEEDSPTVTTYIESLLSEMTGGHKVILILENDGRFLSIINSLEYVRSCDNTSICKREIFKCIRIVETLKKEYFPR